MESGIIGASIAPDSAKLHPGYLLAGYIYSKLEELGFDKINELIPHEYIDGKNHGKREGKGSIFDLRVDAGGLEVQLEELKDRYYKYLFSRCEAILGD